MDERTDKCIHGETCKFFTSLASDTRDAARAFVKVHDVRSSDGGSIFKDNPIYKKTTGKDHPLIKTSIAPKGAIFVWDLYFNKLRGTGVSFTEIKAYQDLYGVYLAPWQIDLIFVIHHAVEGYFNEKQRKAMNKGKK